MANASMNYSITINMNEYHDRYTIARLIGSAPGLVGYGEGGQLTEGSRIRPGVLASSSWLPNSFTAVRRRPYAVLLDEIEKALPKCR